MPPQAVKSEQTKLFQELDPVCPLLCNNTNMMNEEFLTELAKKELWEPGPWKSPGVPVKQQSETKKHLIIPTAQGYVAYNIRGLLWYPPKEKKFYGKDREMGFHKCPIHRNLWWIHDKILLYQWQSSMYRLCVMYERIKRSNKPYCLRTREERCKDPKMWNDYYGRIKCSYCIQKLDPDCEDIDLKLGWGWITFWCKQKRACEEKFNSFNHITIQLELYICIKLCITSHA